MAKLTREQERLHAEACRLINLSRDLTEDEREFVLNHWLESSTTSSASDRAHFTPAGLARDMSLEVGGDRIIDLCAGNGRLAFHNRDLWGRWPHPGPEMTCIERNPDYVRVGRRVMPEARWICADVMDLPKMCDDLGMHDVCISNPPFGAIPRTGNAPRPSTSPQPRLGGERSATSARSCAVPPQRDGPTFGRRVRALRVGHAAAAAGHGRVLRRRRR